MSNADLAALNPHSYDRRTAIQRLLFVADAAVADVNELPSAVRTVIDAAAPMRSVTGRSGDLHDRAGRCRARR